MHEKGKESGWGDETGVDRMRNGEEERVYKGGR